jgi:integrase
MMDYIEDFLKQQYAKPTRKSYRSLLKSFENYLNKIYIDSDPDPPPEKVYDSMMHFTIEDVIKFYESKQEDEARPWESGTIYTFITIIKVYAKWRIKQISRERTQIVDFVKNQDEFKRLSSMIHDFEDVVDYKRPKLPETIKLETPMTLKVMEDMFKMMLQDQEDTYKVNFKTAWCIWWFGCRPGELVRIDTDEGISIINQQVTFVTEKTRKERYGFFDDFTGSILSDFKTHPERINVSPTTAWRRISKYSHLIPVPGAMDFRVFPRLGRRCFITFMDGRGFDDDTLLEDFPISKLDDKFLKMLCGHTITGMNDITQVYKMYPPSLQKAYILKYHYMIPLEGKIEKYMR